MSESEAALNCPKCGSSTVRRSRRANAAEMVRMMIGVYPFRCTTCGDRFWANVWLFNSWKWAKCPRCLNLNLTDWPKRHYRSSTWGQILTTLGGQRHRCSRCRHNFISFRSRLPQHQGAVADLDDLDFDDERPIPSPASGKTAAAEPPASNPK
jgi:DNA-directed RNA polymerase subunit RPC12/RpoP